MSTASSSLTICRAGAGVVPAKRTSRGPGGASALAQAARTRAYQLMQSDAANQQRVAQRRASQDAMAAVSTQYAQALLALSDARVFERDDDSTPGGSGSSPGPGGFAPNQRRRMSVNAVMGNRVVVSTTPSNAQGGGARARSASAHRGRRSSFFADHSHAKAARQRTKTSRAMQRARSAALAAARDRFTYADGQADGRGQGQAGSRPRRYSVASVMSTGSLPMRMAPGDAEVTDRRLDRNSSNFTALAP